MADAPPGGGSDRNSAGPAPDLKAIADAAGRHQWTPAQLGDAERLFARTECSFVKGVVDTAGLPPPDRVEVAFAGRSNVGKSSLLNALVGRRDIARTSNTPGRTQEINYFAFGSLAYIVDLPGYGYARAPRHQVNAWNALIRDFLRGRVSLRRVFLLVDARHGAKPIDLEILTMLDKAAVSFQVALTKVDKLKPGQLERVTTATAERLRTHPAAFPRVLQTSSTKKTGINTLRAEMAELLASSQP